ncbi:MAG TPA: BPSL0067 family protein [Roseiarcus sp.]|nr:BPSL0067 family protein [Roseiarcus sp.]
MATVCRSPVLWRRESAARTGKRTRRESTQWLWPLLAPVGLALVVAGGESWADPAIVSPNGLSVQVHPTFPEPGLPAFNFPQGGLSDTGAVAGAVTVPGGSDSGSTTDSNSGSYSGTGSGVAGAIVAAGYSDLLGQSVGTGECVALAQATSNVGYTSTWSPGAQVQGDTDIAAGTVIATFGSDGTYTNTYGQSHTAIYLGQSDQGILVEDQWLGHAASTRVIPWTTDNSYESGSKFYVVTHD